MLESQAFQAARAKWLLTKGSIDRYLNGIVLKVTRDCNLRCAYCYASGGVDSAVLSPDLALRLLDEASELTPFPIGVYLHGGEPLLASDFLRVFVPQIARRDYYSRIRLGIQTNGTVIDDSWATFFSTWNLKVGVSLDAVSEDGNALRGVDCIADTFEGLEILDRYGIPYSIASVVTKQNITSLCSLFDFARAHSVNTVVLNNLVPRGYGAGLVDIMPTADELFHAMKEVLSWILSNNQEHPSMRVYERNLSFLIRNILHPTRKAYMCLSSPCGAGTQHVALDVDGTTYICDVFVGDDNFALGNLQSDSLKDMLSTPLTKRFRNRTVDTIDKCVDCCLRPYCSGGCPALAYYSGGRIEDEAPTCAYYEKMIPHILQLIREGNMDTSLILGHGIGG